MRKLLTALLFLASPGFASASILASYTTHTNAGELITGKSGATNFPSACQPFTVSANGTLGVVQAELLKVGAPAGTLRFRVYNNGVGASNPPAGTLLGSNDTVTDTSNTSTYTYVSATLTSGFSATTATTYWFCVDSTGTNSTTDFWKWGMGGTAIPYDPDVFEQNTTWVVETGFNLDFEADTAAAASPTMVQQTVFRWGGF